MAAAVVAPLIAQVAPSLIDLIVSLVHQHAPVAQANSPVSGTGPIRFVDVFNNVLTALQSAAAAGMIDKNLPPDDTIKMLIQTTVTSMQKMGLLASAPPPDVAVPTLQTTTPTPPGAQTITLKPGQYTLVVTGS